MRNVFLIAVLLCAACTQHLYTVETVEGGIAPENDTLPAVIWFIKSDGSLYSSDMYVLDCFYYHPDRYISIEDCCEPESE